MSSIYLTGLVLPQQSPRKSIINKQDEKIIKNEYLKFLLEEETPFADIKSIESHFRSELLKRHSKYDENKTILIKKYEEYESLLRDIEMALLSHYKVTNHDGLGIFDSALDNYNQLIKEKEHEKEVYSTMHNRLYHNHFMMKKRIETEITYESMNYQQISQYKMINNNAINTIKNKYILLNQMRQYSQKSQLKNDGEVQKKEKVNQMYQSKAALLKETIVDYEKKIERYKQKGSAYKAKIKENKHLNEMTYKALVHTRIDYHQCDLKIMLTLRSGQAKDVYTLIHLIKVNRKENRYFESLYEFNNEEIMKLKDQLHSINQEILICNQKIEHKIKGEHLLENDNDIHKQKGLINQVNFICSQMESTIEKKIHYFNVILNFLVKYFRLMVQKDNEILTAITHPPLLDLLSNTNDYIIPLDGIDINISKMILSLFIHFSTYFNKGLFTMISSAINHDNNQQSHRTNRSNKRKATNEPTEGIQKPSVEIINISSREGYEMYQKAIIHRHDVNNDIHDINSSTVVTHVSNIDQKSNSKGFIKMTTQPEILSKFMTYLTNKAIPSINQNDNSKSQNIDSKQKDMNGVKCSLIKNNQHRFSMIFSKYQSDLVVNEKIVNSLKEQSHKKPKTKINIITKEYTKPKKSLCVSNDKNELDDSYPSTMDDIARDDNLDNEEYRRKHAADFAFSKQDPEMTKIYHRFNDIRDLDLKYNRIPDIKINKEQFEQAYYKLMKKDLKQLSRNDNQFTNKNTNLFYRTGFNSFKSRNQEINQLPSMKTTSIDGFPSMKHTHDLSRSVCKKKTHNNDNEEEQKNVYPMINNKTLNKQSSMPNIYSNINHQAMSTKNYNKKTII